MATIWRWNNKKSWLRCW